MHASRACVAVHAPPYLDGEVVRLAGHRLGQLDGHGLGPQLHAGMHPAAHVLHRSVCMQAYACSHLAEHLPSEQKKGSLPSGHMPWRQHTSYHITDVRPCTCALPSPPLWPPWSKAGHLGRAAVQHAHGRVLHHRQLLRARHQRRQVLRAHRALAPAQRAAAPRHAARPQ